MKMKKQLNFYPAYDVTGMTEHLEAMAARGWRIEKPGLLFWQYRQAEPADLSFSIQYATETKGSNMKPSFGSAGKDSGWTLEASSDKMQIYSTDQESPRSLNPDPFDRIEGIRQAAKPMVILYVLMMAFAVMDWGLTFFRMKVQPIAAMSDSFGLALCAVLTVSFFYFAADLIHYYRWRSNAEIAATRKEFLPTGTGAHRKAGVCLWICAILAGVFVLTAGKSLVLRIFVVYTAGVLILAAAVSGVRKYLQSRKVRGGRRIALITDFVLAAIVLVAVFSAASAMEKADKGSAADLPVTVQELYADTEDQEFSQYYKKKGTFLLTYAEAAQAQRNDEGTFDPVFTYEIVESGLVDVHGFVVEHYLRRMEAVQEPQEDGTMVSVLSYEPSDPEPWGAEKVWQLSQKGTLQPVYLVLYEKDLLEIRSNLGFEAEQMELVGARFGN